MSELAALPPGLVLVLDDVQGELSAAEILDELTYFLSTVRAGSTWY